MLVYIWINAASSAVFALSRSSSRDREQALNRSVDAAFAVTPRLERGVLLPTASGAGGLSLLVSAFLL
jgi:hypothetical protein